MPAVRVGPDAGEIVRVRGLVQGVGFRPTVWRLARQHGLRGWVNNDGDGVLAHVCGASSDIAAFVEDLAQGAPPLARIDSIEREAAALLPDADAFRIVPSSAGEVHTAVAPDAATCEDCLGRSVIPRRGAFSIRSPTARIAGRACRLYRPFPMIELRRRCAFSPCVPHVAANTKIPPTGASMPSRLPARIAGRACR